MLLFIAFCILWLFFWLWIFYIFSWFCKKKSSFLVIFLWWIFLVPLFLLSTIRVAPSKYAAFSNRGCAAQIECVRHFLIEGGSANRGFVAQIWIVQHKLRVRSRYRGFRSKYRECAVQIVFVKKKKQALYTMAIVG